MHESIIFNRLDLALSALSHVEHPHHLSSFINFINDPIDMGFCYKAGAAVFALPSELPERPAAKGILRECIDRFLQPVVPARGSV